MKTSNSTRLYLFSTEERRKMEETVMYIRRIVATLYLQNCDPVPAKEHIILQTLVFLQYLSSCNICIHSTGMKNKNS